VSLYFCQRENSCISSGSSWRKSDADGFDQQLEEKKEWKEESQNGG
jgi:hypothetical protein